MLTDDDIALHKRIIRSYELQADQAQRQIEAAQVRLRYYEGVVRSERAILAAEGVGEVHDGCRSAD